MRLAASDGDTVSITLHPDDLGQVTVTIERSDDGGTTIHMAAEHLATMNLLRDGQSDLAAALNQAGVQHGDQGLSFSWSGGMSGWNGSGGQGWQQADGQSGGGQQPASAAQLFAPATALPAPSPASGGGVDLTA